MIALLAAVMALQDSPPLNQLKWLIRHQREDGSWSSGPVGCECAKDQPAGKEAKRDPAAEKAAAPHLESLKKDDDAVREEAVKGLIAIGASVEPILRDALRTAEGDARELLKGALRRVVQARVPGDVEATSLALLAFLGASYSHLSREVYENRVVGDVIKNGIKWLLTRQNPRGLIGPEVPRGVGVGHVLATLVLSESYTLTATKLLQQPGLNALDYAVSLQRKSGAFGPGRDDAVTSLWCVLLCHSAQLAQFEIPKEVPAALTKWLETNSGKGRDTEAAALVLSKCLLVKDSAGMAEIAERLSALPLENPDGFQRAAVSLALLHHEGVTGDRWKRWRKPALHEWIKLEKEGCERGSRAGTGSPVVTTSLNVISLESLYVYSRVLGSPKTRDWPPERPK